MKSYVMAALLLATWGAGGAQAQLLANRPFMKSIDGAISARLSGPACGETVDVVFSGADAATFNRDGVATRLMNNVVANVKSTCPRVRMVASRGVVGERIVYNAIAESATNWLLLELGSARDASLLGSSDRGKAADKGAFARRADFAGLPTLVQKIGGRGLLCSGLDAGSCTAVMDLRSATPAGAAVVSRSLLDSTGTQAVLSYRAQNVNGFLCSNPQTSSIEVIGGQATPQARRRMATDLRERLKPYGDEVCSGFAIRGANIISANFDAAGARIGAEGVMAPQATMPRLRQAQ
ncbi:MAG: hypothetical protein AB1942_03600 [Pseudomonadota bacterium]